MTPRNVVVFVCDQLRADFLSAYGGQGIETPGIDWLAAHGVTFEHAITQSTVCGPARATMMTGRHVSDHGAWTNDIAWRTGIDTIGERMTAAGYRTGCFGKMHHTPATDPKGFEVAHLFEENRLGQSEPYLAWLQEQRPEARQCFQEQNLQSTVTEEQHYEHWIASRALDFVQTEDDRPFLAWISFQGPHSPYDPVDGMAGLVDETVIPAAIDPGELPEQPYRRTRAAWAQLPSNPAEIHRYRTAYARMIAQIDRQVSRVLRALDESGQLETTTVLFTSDHGDELGDHGLDKKGPFPYRGSLQIPLIVANHPRVGEGLATDALAGNIDLAGTILDIAGESRRMGHSRSLIDLAQPAPLEARDTIVSEFADHMLVVDSPRFRHVHYPFLDAPELFDLAEDPDCRNNLAGKPEYAATELALQRALIDHAALCRGPRFNAFDLVPEVQKGLERMDPAFRTSIPIAFPLSARQHQLLQQAGQDATYNEFCRGREIIAHYGTYWGAGTGAPQGARRTPVASA